MADMNRPNFIGGTWELDEPTAVEVINPATGEVIARTPDTSAESVDRAVTAARAAFGAWSATNPFDRSATLHTIADRISGRVDEIATAITLEMGKPLDEARGEVRKLADAFHYYAEETTRVYGRTIPNAENGFLSIVEYEPVGVVGAVTPWNYPVELIGWKLAAALGAGCTVILKPSEFTPTSAVLLFKCLEGLVPAGVANVVLGAGGAGRALVSHAELDKIAFTGSSETGAAISRSTARAIPVSMELGGSCPMIVTATADVDAAIRGTVRRGYRNAGQICIAVNRSYVQRAVYDEYVEKLAEAVAALQVGDGMEHPAIDMGPVANQEIIDKCTTHIADALALGGRVVTGGHLIEELRPGNFIAPAVVADVTSEMLLDNTETFGPVVGVAVFDELDEALARANGTSAGLAAYVYSRDLEETMDLGRRLDFGNVAVNNVDAGIMNAPYGGRKGSGHGSEHGPEGLEGYLHPKHMRMRWAR